MYIKKYKLIRQRENFIHVIFLPDSRPPRAWSVKLTYFALLDSTAVGFYFIFEYATITYWIIHPREPISKYIIPKLTNYLTWPFTIILKLPLLKQSYQVLEYLLQSILLQLNLTSILSITALSQPSIFKIEGSISLNIVHL